MNKVNFTYKKEFKIRSYEVGSLKNTSLLSICNYFQEVAGLHAHELNFDIEDLHKKGLTWVLYKMHVNVIRYPLRWETVHVETWPSIGDGFRAYRDYKMTDNNGNVVALGVSQWIVLDINKRRAVKLPDEIKLFGQQVSTHVIEPKGTFDAPVSEMNHLVTTVGNFDLDMNNHPNNVAYINWLTGYIDSELLEKKECIDFQIQYMAEAKLHDQIYLKYTLSENSDGLIVNHSISNKPDGKELAIALSMWR
ncbi:MAG: hypothetical protein JJU37_11015 [Balneolaceae bacterium]|nr:hypothetical protein [Balneolaceae bacterium]